MAEHELQTAVAKLIDDGNLYDSVNGKEEVDRSLAAITAPEMIPSFPIDYLIRKKCLQAAKNVLPSLVDVEVISTKSKSIALDKKELLYPDFLLCNRLSASIIVVELKVGNQTPRQTITETMAYAHEVRNHLPFLSSYELQFVIISEEYSTLLDHSIASLITWESHQILCLRAMRSGETIDLSIHIPDCWTALGQSGLPSEALSTFTLYLYPKDDDSGEVPWEILRTALSLIVRAGDRSNEHGFIFLWKNLWQGDGGQCLWNFTVGLLNPYAFFPSAVSDGFADPTRSILAQYSTLR